MLIMPDTKAGGDDNEDPGDEDDSEGGEENDTEDDVGEDQIVSNYCWLDTGLVAWRDSINYWSLCDNITCYNRQHQLSPDFATNTTSRNSLFTWENQLKNQNTD